MPDKLVDMVLEWKATKSISTATEICNYLVELVDEISNT